MGIKPGTIEKDFGYIDGRGSIDYLPIRPRDVPPLGRPIVYESLGRPIVWKPISGDPGSSG